MFHEGMEDVFMVSKEYLIDSGKYLTFLNITFFDITFLNQILCEYMINR